MFNGNKPRANFILHPRALHRTHSPMLWISVCASHCSCGLRLACHMPHGAAGVAATYGQSKHVCCSPIRLLPQLADLLMLCLGSHTTTSKPLWVRSTFPLPLVTGTRRKKLVTKKREQRTVLHTFLVLSRFLCVKKIFPYDKETKQKYRNTNKQISTEVKRKRNLKIK